MTKTYFYVASVDPEMAQREFCDTGVSTFYHRIGIFTDTDYTPDQYLRKLNRFQLMKMEFTALIEFDSEVEAETYIDALFDIMKREMKSFAWFYFPTSIVEFSDGDFNGRTESIGKHKSLETPVIESIKNMDLDHLRFVYDNQFYDEDYM